MITADLTRNPRQEAFFLRAMEAAFGDNPYRYLFYGGAIRGGKTFACLVTLVMLCRLFPGSKWYVVRKSMPRLEETAIPTMEKILGQNANVRWSRKSTNYFVEFKKFGSRVYFASEDYSNDPKLDWMLGLECNGFFLEQMEELQEVTLNMAISRAGSWIIDKMPSPLILGSFNRTMTWVKQRIVDRWQEGKLEAPYHFEEAQAIDNPWNTKEQWANWSNLPDDLFQRFVGEKGWEFTKPPNVFAYAFDKKKHHKDVHFNSDWPLYLSFDFNVEPITCLASQHDPHATWVHVVKEYRLLVSDIWALTDHIVANVPEAFFMVTGDASGSNRIAITRDNVNYYHIIRQQLALEKAQLRIPRANPSLRNTRVLCNALLQKHPQYWINTEACPHLTLDLDTVEWRNDDLDEGKDKRKGHLLDGFRYYNWTWHRDFIPKSLYQYFEND